MTLWSAIHAERAALAEDLEALEPPQWRVPSLCGSWTVEEVVAHLTAAASLGQLRWLASMVAARFNPDLHNARRLAAHVGTDPDDPTPAPPHRLEYDGTLRPHPRMAR